MKAEKRNTLAAEFVAQFYLSSNIYSNLYLTEFEGQCGHKLRRRQEHGGIEESVIGIIHLIHLKYRFKTALIKSTIVCNKGQTANLWFNLLPNLVKARRLFRITFSESMHFSAPI